MLAKLTRLVTLLTFLLQACGGPPLDGNERGAPSSGHEQAAPSELAGRVLKSLGPEASPNLAEYTAEQLVRGIAFGDGPVADVIPTIRDNVRLSLRIKDPDQLADAHAFIDRLMEQMLAKDPEAFGAFRAEILTGDHLRIRDGLGKLQGLAVDVLNSQPEMTQLASLRDESRGMCLFAGPVVVAYALVVLATAVWEAAAVAVHAAVAVNVVVAAVAWTSVAVTSGQGGAPGSDCRGRDCQTSSSSLLTENVIQEISTYAVPIWSWQPGFKLSPHEGYTGAVDSGIVLGDFSGDGIKDRAYWNWADSQVDIFVDGTGQPWSYTFPYDAMPLVGDFDGNGQDDIMWRNTNWQTTWYFSGSGVTVRTSAHADNRMSMRPVVGDFNGDNVKDVFWYGSGDLADDVYFGQWDQSFKQGYTAGIGGNAIPVVGDFMPEETSDIVFYENGGTHHTLWEVHPTTGVTIDTTGWTVETPPQSLRPFAADLDLNGKDDIYWQKWQYNNQDVIWAWDGSLGGWYTYGGAGMSAGLRLPATGDVTGDGWPETIWWSFGKVIYPEAVSTPSPD